MIALTNLTNTEFTATFLGGDKLSILMTDAPSRVVEAHSSALQGPGGFADLQQQQFVVCAASRQRRSPPSKGGANNIKADHLGVKFNHRLHSAHVKHVVAKRNQQTTPAVNAQAWRVNAWMPVMYRPRMRL